MRKFWRAITSGFVSTLVMLLVLLMIEVQTRAKLELFEALARFFLVPEQVGLGFFIFVLFGVVFWPLLFAVIEPYIPPRDDQAVSGMVFGSVLWVGFVLIGTAELVIFFFPFYVAVTLITHLVYGFTLGLVYGWAPLVSNSETHTVGHEVNGSEP